MIDYFNEGSDLQERDPITGKPIFKAKDVIGMNMKLHGRNINKFYCKKCLMKLYDMDKEKWNSEVERFKQQGCDLF